MLGGHTALCKVQCTKVMEYCAREAAQIFGGLSYSRGGQGEKVERLNREVRAMAIPGGSEEIMLDLGVKQSTKLAQMAKMFAEAAPAAQPAKLWVHHVGVKQAEHSPPQMFEVSAVRPSHWIWERPFQREPSLEQGAFERCFDTVSGLDKVQNACATRATCSMRHLKKISVGWGCPGVVTILHFSSFFHIFPGSLSSTVNLWGDWMGFAHPRDLLASWGPRSRHASLWRHCPLLPTPFGSLDSAGRMESCGRLPCDSMTCLSIMMYASQKNMTLKPRKWYWLVSEGMCWKSLKLSDAVTICEPGLSPAKAILRRRFLSKLWCAFGCGTTCCGWQDSRYTREEKGSWFHGRLKSRWWEHLDLIVYHRFENVWDIVSVRATRIDQKSSEISMSICIYLYMFCSWKHHRVVAKDIIDCL